jgi:hypothetical protein
MRLDGTFWRALRAVVVAGAAALVFFQLIPQTTVRHNELGSLMVTRTALRGVPAKPRLSEWVAPSSSTFDVTRQAAKRDPDHTGLFAREWYVSQNGPPEVGMVVQLLPDAATAERSVANVRSQLLAAPQLSGEKAGQAQPFPIPGVPGGRGVAFALSDSNVPANGVIGYAYKTVYRFDRAVVSALIADTGKTKSTQAAVADAQAGYRLLQEREPGFSFAHQRFPVVASIVFAVVALVVVAAAVVVPELVLVLLRRRRARRHERAQARARQQYLARGRRTVRRHGAPPWAQTKRR